MKRRLVLLTFLCVFLVPALVYANAIPWPDWKDSDLTLWAIWNNKVGNPSNWGTNPEDSLIKPNMSWWANGPGFKIEAANYDNLNPLKIGWVLLAISVPLPSPTLYAVSSFDNDVGELLDYGFSDEYGKFYYIWSFELEPNPCFEKIFIDFVSNQPVGMTNCATGDCLPEYVVALATKCVVPIPGAVWLLGAGLVGLVGFRKRFRM
ncbi:MAG: hypothetical protein HY788_08700 [Deltaproteobacteria bacterium]|nr:hypothetical protein [Deltaproteobacteria bacterium]